MNEKFSEIMNIVSGTSNVLGDMSLTAFLLLLVISLVTSIFIGFLYLYFYQSKTTGSEVYRAFPLLGLSVSAIFVCVQFSLPLSLGLLGALSIVRFRTPIKEPEEIGFIMLIIASSIAIATFNLLFLGLLLTVATSGLFLVHHVLKGFPSHRREGIVVLSFSSERYTSSGLMIDDFLADSFRGLTVDNISESDNRVVATYRFRDLSSLPISKIRQSIVEQFDPDAIKIILGKPVTL